MLQIDPKNLSVAEVQKLLQGGVAPRPIALVSTISADGAVNLSPFSFFNVFSSNPPIVGFSAARRGRDGSLKDTYRNIMETKECVIHAVTYDMVEQTSLASTEYEADINEFLKAGFTPVPSLCVLPPRVKESPFHMECKLTQMIPLGTEGGAGNLALCEVVQFHVNEEIFTHKIIDPQRIDLVARMSADYYCRASGSSVFTVEKPLQKKGIGVDMLPDFLKCSDLLTGNELAQLANIEVLPDQMLPINYKKMLLEKYPFLHAPDYNSFQIAHKSGEHEKMAAIILNDSVDSSTTYHYTTAAKLALKNGDVNGAWAILLIGHEKCNQ